MRQTGNAVVYISQIYPYGMIRHFALLGCELGTIHSCSYDYYLASIKREPDAGSWRLVRSVMPDERIVTGDSFSDIVNGIEDLFSRYESVLVHFGGGWGMSKALMPLKRKFGGRMKAVATTHSFHLEDKKRIPVTLALGVMYRRLVDCVVFPCAFAARRFVGSKRLFMLNRAAIIPLGVEEFPESSDTVPESVAAMPGLAELLGRDDLFKFIYLARYHAGKNHVWLVRAMAPVLRRHPEAHILFCGEGSMGLARNIKAAIEEEGLSGQIHMPGRVPREDVPWVLRHCNCSIVPSRGETFGHNFVEPMMAGLPLFGTRVGIGDAVIMDGLTGMSFSLDNSESVRLGAEVLLSDRELTREMGARSNILAKSVFTHTAVANAYDALYNRILRE